MPAALLVLAFVVCSFGPPRRATFTVTTTADSGAGSLRQAILDANAAAGPDVIRFSIPGGGVPTIQPLSPLPPLGDALSVVAVACSPLPCVELDGGLAGAGADGFVVDGSDVLVKGFVINRFDGAGVRFTGNAGNSSLVASRIGTNVAGGVARPNANGVFLEDGASNNTIGGTAEGDGNLISGNTGTGILITGHGTNNNRVEGNFIGTGVGGTGALPNNDGVEIRYGARSNVVGGLAEGTGNLISGNDDFGVAVYDGIFADEDDTSDNRIRGNLIGTNVHGTAALPNEKGVLIAGGLANIIGGRTIPARNVISGNQWNGVEIVGEDTDGTRVEGNYIGTGVGGTGALPNNNGVAIGGGAHDTVIGGTAAGARNVISGNTSYGVAIDASNSGPGLTGVPTQDNRIEGNYIGTGWTGATAVPNGSHGVLVYFGAETNIIGGTAADAGNVISGNGGSGVVIEGERTDGNRVEGNFIGVNHDESAGLPNGGHGVLVADLAGYNNASPFGENVIGGTDPAAANVIAFNTLNGVLVKDFGTRCTLLGNRISSNGALGIDLIGDGITPNDPGDGDNGPNDALNYPVLTSATSDGSTTTVAVSLDTVPNEDFRVEFFHSGTADPSGYGEGRTFATSRDVTTNSGGTANLVFTVATSVLPVGRFVAATATLLSSGGTPLITSEFGAAVEVDGPTVDLTLTAFLQGPYDAGTGTMTTALLDGGYLPTTQPFQDAAYDGTPLDYDGNESVSGAFPVGTVDWVLVELRSSTAAASIVAQQAALLLQSGLVVGVDGSSPLSFPGLVESAYYVVLRHRTHLAVMSAAAVNCTSGSCSYDFSTALGQAYTDGGTAMVGLGAGGTAPFACFSGDGDADGLVSASDYQNHWRLQNGGAAGYLSGDFDMTGQVTATDYQNHWRLNNGTAQSQVPDP